jgi:hypothetical protein
VMVTSVSGLAVAATFEMSLVQAGNKWLRRRNHSRVISGQTLIFTDNCAG